MALNIKDPETERLAARVADLAHENKTQAIRTALRERMERLEEADDSPRARRQRLWEVLETQIWPMLDPAELGRPRLTKEEEDEILGFGPEGF